MIHNKRVCEFIRKEKKGFCVSYMPSKMHLMTCQCQPSITNSSKITTKLKLQQIQATLKITFVKLTWQSSSKPIESVQKGEAKLGNKANKTSNRPIRFVTMGQSPLLPKQVGSKAEINVVHRVKKECCSFNL